MTWLIEEAEQSGCIESRRARSCEQKNRPESISNRRWVCRCGWRVRVRVAFKSWYRDHHSGHVDEDSYLHDSPDSNSYLCGSSDGNSCLHGCSDHAFRYYTSSCLRQRHRDDCLLYATGGPPRVDNYLCNRDAHRRRASGHP